MSLLDLYRQSYEHEKDSNQKMIAMIGSVPAERRREARFQQAVTLAGHLAACRENWLDRIEGHKDTAPWWDEACDFATLRPRFTALESRWTDYLAHVTEDQVAQDFEFSEGGEEHFRVPLEVQIVQLVGHAAYHRGQVALMVDELGGETVDTDYVDWWWNNVKDKR